MVERCAKRRLVAEIAGERYDPDPRVTPGGV